MTDQELAQALTGALDARIARAEAAPVSIADANRMPPKEIIAANVIKAVPAKQARWKTAAAAVLALAMLGGAGFGAYKLVGRNLPGNTEPSPSIVTTTEPAEPETPPQVEYDEATKTIRITGTRGYDKVDLAPYISEAQYLEVEDDEYRFSDSVSTLANYSGSDRSELANFLPSQLDKLDRTTSFFKQYVAAHAPNEAVAAQARKTVNYSVKAVSAPAWKISQEQIDLTMGDYFVYMYDYCYALALMDPEEEAWQHQGFILWMETINPYNYRYKGNSSISPDYDYYYYADYFRVGGTGNIKEAKEVFLLYDACAWYNLTNGMNWPGRNVETHAILRSSGSAADPAVEGNDVSVIMAESLINYLAEQYGEDKVVAYCFDTCTFEEAFGVNYATARAAWEQSLKERFGDGSETKPAASELPTVEFDEETKTLHITGIEGYDQLDLSEAVNAWRVEVADNDYQFTLSVPVLSSVLDPNGNPAEAVGYLPVYLERLDKSISFIRQFIAENAPNEEVRAQTAKPVDMTLTGNEYYDNKPEQVEVGLGKAFYKHGVNYALGMMSPEKVEWQHLGFAYWLGTSVDPHCSLYADNTEANMDVDYYFFEAYYRAGGTGRFADPKEVCLMNDANAWYNLVHGRNWPGTLAECGTVYDFNYFTGDRRGEGNDMSVTMAESLINYLAEQYGTDKVVAYCFDTCTFEEAFGVSYAAARAAWEQSLMDRFGDGSETTP